MGGYSVISDTRLSLYQCHGGVTMAFSLPAFNLTVDIYSGPWLTRVLRVSSLGNLAFGRRTNIQFGSEELAYPVRATEVLLLLPPLTDIRSSLTSGQADMVECPSGSGRWYQVLAVEDIGKGFPNEHRAASLFQASFYVDNTAFAGLFWPVPMT